MPRGFQRNVVETAERKFLDPRSFIAKGSGCELLYGEDVGARRREIHERAKGRCEAKIHSPRCRGFANWDDGEWHHTYVHDGKRCDCLAGGMWMTRPCHRLEEALCKHSPRIRRERNEAAKAN